VIKKSACRDYQNIRANGINAINIDDGDELLERDSSPTAQSKFSSPRTTEWRFALTNPTCVRWVASRAACAESICEKAISSFRLRRFKRRIEKMLSISEQGFGKQTKVEKLSFDETRRQRRYQYENDRKNRQSRRGFPVEEDSEVMIITQQAKLIRLGR
jgi:DNA gyrase subunit A